MNKIRALIWEQWRHCRLVMLLAPVFILLASTLSALSPADKNVDGAVLTGLCITVFFIAFSLSYCDPRDLAFGFDRRLYRLPLRSCPLAAVTLGARLALATIGMTVVLGMCYWILGRGEAFPFYPTLAFALIVFSGAHALSWSVGAYSAKAAAFALVAVFFWMVAGIFLPLIRDFSGLHLLTELVQWSQSVGGRAGLWVLSLTTIASFSAIAVAGVWLDRRGMLQSYGQKADRISWLANRQRTFASPDAAQFAFEWERRGRLFVRMLLIGFVFLTIAMAVAVHVKTRDINLGLVCASLIYAAFIASPCAAATLGVLNVLMDSGDRKSGVATFLAVRPIPSRSFARARLKVAGRIVLISVALAILPFLLLFALDTVVPSGAHHALAESLKEVAQKGGRDLVGIWAVYILLIWTLTWIWSRMAAIVAAAALLPPLLVILVVKIAIGVSESAEAWVTYIPHFIGGAIMAVTAYAFWNAYRHRLIAGTSSTIAVGLWLTAVIVSHVLWPALNDLLRAGLLALPLLPLATVPLDVYRHRSGASFVSPRIIHRQRAMSGGIL